MITIYGKEAILYEQGEHKTLSVIHIGDKIIFIKDEEVKRKLGSEKQ